MDRLHQRRLARSPAGRLLNAADPDPSTRASRRRVAEEIALGGGGLVGRIVRFGELVTTRVLATGGKGRCCGESDRPNAAGIDGAQAPAQLGTNHVVLLCRVKS